MNRSADPIYWDDAYPIALMLNRAYPTVDPTTVETKVLRDWVIQLDGFADDVDVAPLEWLEQIQVEWVELK
jgi:FeS assembly protein IscX